MGPRSGVKDALGGYAAFADEGPGPVTGLVTRAAGACYDHKAPVGTTGRATPRGP